MAKKKDVEHSQARIIPLGVEVVGNGSDEQAIALVEKKTDLVLHSKPESLSVVDLVMAFTLVTRLSNAIDRRKKKLRAQVDQMIEKDPPREDDYEVLYSTGTGFAVSCSNSGAGKKALNKIKAQDLLRKKEEETGKPLLSSVMVIPPVPLPQFSVEKFEALVTLGILSQEDVDGCYENAPVSTSVSVECDDIYDDAITKLVLGPKSK